MQDDHKEYPDKIIQEKTILDLMYGDKDYFIEFVLASIESFQEFRKMYNIAVRENDLKILRNAGHKINPAALMMNLNRFLELYTATRNLLEENRSEELASVAMDMNNYCNQLLSDLNNMLD